LTASPVRQISYFGPRRIPVFGGLLPEDPLDCPEKIALPLSASYSTSLELGDRSMFGSGCALALTILAHVSSNEAMIPYCSNFRR